VYKPAALKHDGAFHAIELIGPDLVSLTHFRRAISILLDEILKLFDLLNSAPELDFACAKKYGVRPFMLRNST
jgi:hypothetical protein